MHSAAGQGNAEGAAPSAPASGAQTQCWDLSGVGSSGAADIGTVEGCWGAVGRWALSDVPSLQLPWGADEEKKRQCVFKGKDPQVSPGAWDVPPGPGGAGARVQGG